MRPGPASTAYTDTALAAEAAAAAEGDVVRLRLHCESLGRRLQAAEARVAALQREQDEVLVVNERLRAAIETGPAKAAGAPAPAGRGGAAQADEGDGAPRCSADAAGAQHQQLKAAVAFLRGRLEQEGALAGALTSLLRAVHEAVGTCRAALEGRDESTPSAASAGDGAYQLFGIADLHEARGAGPAARTALVLPMAPLRDVAGAVLRGADGAPGLLHLLAALQQVAAQAAGSSTASTSLDVGAAPTLDCVAAAGTLEAACAALQDLQRDVADRIAASVTQSCATQ